MFLLKKIIASGFYPLSLSLEVLLLGLIFLWFTRRQRTGKAIVSLGFIILVVFSYGVFSDDLLRPLEYKYPAIDSPEEVSEAKWVVVLGGGHVSDPRIPITSQLSDTPLVRLVEGIRIHRLIPESRLVLSGGTLFDPVPEARIMADLAVAIGVNKKDIVLESLSKDTEDEAQLVQKIVGGDRFVLVTSASHMPRSIALFEKLVMRPIPAPTGHLLRESYVRGPSSIFPDLDNLRGAETAFHEYLGLAWAKIRGQI